MRYKVVSRVDQHSNLVSMITPPSEVYALLLPPLTRNAAQVDTNRGQSQFIVLLKSKVTEKVK